MFRSSWRLILPFSFLLAAAVPTVHGQDKDKEKPPVRVILVTGSGHDYPKFTIAMDKLFDQVGGLKIVQRLEPAKGAGEAHIRKLADIKNADGDVLLFFTVGYKLEPLEERALETFVDNGGGLVALHCASASFGSSQTWWRLIGAKFTGHYKGLHKLDIKITDSKHPIMNGVEPFTIIDEEYNHNFAKVERKVLAEFKERPEGSKGKNNDVVWTRDVGKGRVVYSALGHGADAWANPAWQKMVVQSIFWSAGQPRAVTIPEKK